MITGFNTDVKRRTTVFHVQTEDKGSKNPVIETLVYKGGEILGAKRLNYADKVKDRSDEKTILALMEEQHNAVIASVKEGRYDPQPLPISEDLTIDGLVLEFLEKRSPPA
jgi:hypothetical protein